MNRTALPRLSRTLAALLLALLALSACGGGDADEQDPRSTTGPVNCKDKPEICR